MRVVFDTNVLVSALLTPTGPCAEVVDLAASRVLVPCIDARLMEEYEDVLHRPKLEIDAANADGLCELIRGVGAVTDAEPLLARLPHPSDLPFLEVAAAARAVLVTGNKRDFPKRQCAGVRVLSPRELLDLLREEGQGPRHSKEV